MVKAKKAGASWSGGKDSCLAVHMAMKQGYEIRHLLNFVSDSTGRCCFHGLEAGLLRLQAQLMGIPLVQKSMPDDMKAYETEFRKAVKGLEGIEYMVFGDIYLDEHKEWVDNACAGIKMKVVEPLWNEPAGKVAREFVDAGYKAVVVSCQAEKLDRSFAGRMYDMSLISDLEAKGICPCGENGEFHTLVTDGPTFKRPIEIIESVVVQKSGFWTSWVLDIRRYR